MDFTDIYPNHEGPASRAISGLTREIGLVLAQTGEDGPWDKIVGLAETAQAMLEAVSFIAHIMGAIAEKDGIDE
jgi:hypothetical protein